MAWIFRDERVEPREEKINRSKVIKRKNSNEVFGYSDKRTKKPSWGSVVLGRMKG